VGFVSWNWVCGTELLGVVVACDGMTPIVCVTRTHSEILGSLAEGGASEKSLRYSGTAAVLPCSVPVRPLASITLSVSA
jgi:hypothetical protein